MKPSLSWMFMLLLVKETISQDFMEPSVNILIELKSIMGKIKVMEEKINELQMENREQNVQIEALKVRMNTTHGIFTAPVKGVYYFNIVLFNANPPSAGVHIIKNRARVVSITDNPPGEDSEDTASNSVTLLLEKGDQIHIELIEKRKVYTDLAGRNSFSGHLLFPTE
ncbi:complement C1q subcomponent subunit C-like [Silurus meridionalis]|uniref:C1q domain-containing protein n=1 Tax=Silurus meridionalis TaxID=175797 RepID=A0A8T0BIV3_SILME|nr:complement C1q subcomponent subunit C-like [Silurus meridionalis]KAF7706013.1 hypothetical protein HF521_019267 [Silurus meridionalis]KAI5103727.1 hypothetical protein C0J45_5353 [Silurus meridionalis]